MFVLVGNRFVPRLIAHEHRIQSRAEISLEHILDPLISITEGLQGSLFTTDGLKLSCFDVFNVFSQVVSTALDAIFDMVQNPEVIGLVF